MAPEAMCATDCSGCSTECAACASGCFGCGGCDSARLAFDPGQPRDADGQWSDGAGDGWSLPKPDGSVTFPGSSQPAVEGRKAFSSLPDQDEVRGRISDQPVADLVEQAVSNYGGNGHLHMNLSLRKGEGLHPGEKRQVPALDAAIDNSPLPEDAILWRGAAGDRMFPAGWLDGSLVGAEWTDPSFSSTSANDDVGKRFASPEQNPNPVLLRLLAPAGTKGLKIGKWGGGGMGKEAEVLLGRNTRFRVVADHGAVKGVRRLDVQVISGKQEPV